MSNILNIILSDERSNRIDAISSGLSVPQKQIKIENHLLNKVINQKFCTKKITNLLKKNNKNIPANKYNNKITSLIIGDRYDLIEEIKKNLKKDKNINTISYNGNIFKKTYDKSIDKIYNAVVNFYNKNKRA